LPGNEEIIANKGSVKIANIEHLGTSPDLSGYSTLIRNWHGGLPRTGLLARNDFRVARNPSRTDAQRGDHFLQADFRVLIRTFSGRMLAQVCEGVVQLANSPACQAGGRK